MGSRNPQVQATIRLLSIWEAEHALRFFSSHIAGSINTAADLSSRTQGASGKSRQFTELTRGWTQVAMPLDSVDIEEI